MKKTYENPMLQFVSIRKSDVIMTSVNASVLSETQDNSAALAPDRNIFNEYWANAGY